MNTSEYFSEIATTFAKQYDTEPAFKERFQIWSRLLDKYAALSSSAIDLGCGAGIFSLYLGKKGIEVLGIDNAGAMLDLAARRAQECRLSNIRFILADVAKLSVQELPSVDLVICSSVLEYIENVEHVLQLFAGVLKPKGHLIVSLPNAESFYRRLEPWQFKLLKRPHYFRHVKFRCSPRALEQRMARHGLSFREGEYYAHQQFISRVAAGLRMPKRLTENLFVSVFQKVSQP
jgi:ubiquinone/menaquinone biosynthesis C-methylase UbiE